MWQRLSSLPWSWFWFFLTYLGGYLLVLAAVHLHLQTALNVIKWYQNLPINCGEFLVFVQLLKG